MTCGIYKLISPSGKFYIGSSKNIEWRFKVHSIKLSRGEHKNMALSRAYMKYNGDLSCKVIIICEQKDLIFYEQICIDGLKPEYNASRIASKVEWTPEIRLRRSKAAIKYWQNTENRMRVSAFHKGRKRSPETCAKISANTKRQMASPEARAATAERNRNRIITPAIRANYAKAKIGSKASLETRAKMSASAKASWQNSDRPRSWKNKKRLAAGETE